MPQSMVRFIGVALLSSGMAIAGCTSNSQTPSTSADSSQTSPSSVPSVVVTSSVVCDMVKQIAQNTVQLDCLLQPGVDPHAYEPIPSDRKAIETADLIFYAGYNYEPDLIRIIQATNTDAPKVAVIESAVANPIMGSAHAHDEHEDEAAHTDEHAEESHTDEHAEESHTDEAELSPDPHAWHDPKHGIQMVQVINTELQQLAPDQATYYNQNANALITEIEQIDQWMEQQVETVPPTVRKLVTTHDSFRYFADRYGFTISGTLSGLSTEQQPTASRIAELVDTIKAAKVPAIFAEGTTNRQWVETVARNADVEIAATPLYVEGPGGTDSDAQTYQQMLIENTCTIVNALSGQCSPDTAP